MVNLSVCLVVRNEGTFLLKTLESVLPFASEILILNTGSTDDTVEIAKKFTHNIYYADWTGSYSDAKNLILAKATSDWVLMLDGDEALDQPSFDSLLLTIDTSSNKVYSFLKYNYYPGGGASCFYQPRFFRNHPKLRYVGDFWDELDYSTLGETEHETWSADVIVHHFAPLKPNYIQKYKNILEIWSKKEIDKHIRKDRDWMAGYLAYHKAAVCIEVGDYQGAINIIGYYLSSISEHGVNIWAQYVKMLKLRVFFNLDNFLGAQDIIFSILENIDEDDPLFPDILNFQGKLYALIAQEQDAIHFYEKALNIKPCYWHVYINIAVLHHLNQQNSLCAKYCSKALEVNSSLIEIESISLRVNNWLRKDLVIDERYKGVLDLLS